MNPCSGNGSHGEVEIEESDGSSSSKPKEYDFCPYSWKHLAWKIQEELSTLATQYWAEGVSTGNGITKKKRG